ncbi:hypothetical protein B0H14DRAFT_3518391 [Mycena olivaceomarginata]|nr:hypothetical protein B0H14DRAFT_3518391 [Mycena olivaceomarginata]
MAPARLSCLDPICARLVKRTSGDMIISGRVYVFGNDLLDEDLRVLPLAPTTPVLTVGNPFVVANRHPKPKETASIPALTSTSTADDRISSSPYAIQLLLLDSAPTSQPIASRRSSPRAAQPYLDSRAIPMRFPTTHTVFEEVHPPRAAARRTWPRRLAPRDNARTSGSRVARSLSCSRGRPARSPSDYPSPFRGDRELSRFEKIKNAESGGAECRAVPCTRGSTAPARSRVLSTPLRSGVCPGAGRGCIAAYCAPSSLIHPHALVASQRRVHYKRLLLRFYPSAQRQESELSPPQVAAEKILRDGAERLNRWPQVPKELSLGLDYTNRPTVFSRPSVHLIYTAQGTCIQSCLPDFSLPIPSHPAACSRIWIMPRCAFEATRGSGSSHGVLAARRIRPFRISTTRRGVQGGAFALQLGDLHAAAWVFGTPQTVYRACGIHFTPLQARWPARVPVLPSGPKSSSTPGFIGDLLYDATSCPPSFLRWEDHRTDPDCARRSRGPYTSQSARLLAIVTRGDASFDISGSSPRTVKRALAGIQLAPALHPPDIKIAQPDILPRWWSHRGKEAERETGAVLPCLP